MACHSTLTCLENSPDKERSAERADCLELASMISATASACIKSILPLRKAHNTTTICALASALGQGGIGVVRVSGTLAGGIIKMHWVDFLCKKGLSMLFSPSIGIIKKSLMFARVHEAEYNMHKNIWK
jgi:hypothetical protein